MISGNSSKTGVYFILEAEDDFQGFFQKTLFQGIELFQGDFISRKIFIFVGYEIPSDLEQHDKIVGTLESLGQVSRQFTSFFQFADPFKTVGFRDSC